MAVITGTFEADVLRGTHGADEIVDRSGGDDLMYGGAGDDTLHLERSNGQADDSARMFGEAGIDRLFAAGVLGGDLRVRMSGGDGDDTLAAMIVKSARMDGDDGNDRIEAFEVSSARIDAGAERDLLAVHSVARAAIDAGTDADYLFLINALGKTIADMGDGEDAVWVAASAADDQTVLTLGAGRDTVYLTADELSGSAHTTSIVITDFEAGFFRDRFDPTSFLQSCGIDAADPFASDHLQVIQRGDSAVLRLDRDAAGTEFGWETLVRFCGVDAATLVPYNLGAPVDSLSVIDPAALTF
jgi:Ca2+-binding RTX toxin-like protein